MKKMVIASIVGGIIIFLWQFVSYAGANLHQDVVRYTDKEKNILAYLEAQGLQEGGYMLPNSPPDATSEQQQAIWDSMDGKPWVSIQYHKALDGRMVLNMIRGLITDFIIVFLFCWILLKIPSLNFRTTLLASLGIGMIVFLNSYYANYIWYKSFDIKASLIDAVVSWGLVGVWLKDRYLWTFVTLFLAVTGLWLGFRHQQGEELRSMEDVVRIQDENLRPQRSPAQGVAVSPQTGGEVASVAEPAQPPANGEDSISDEDLAVVENLELLQDYDILKDLTADKANGDDVKAN